MNDHTRPILPVLLILAAFAGSVAPAWGQAVIFVDASATGSGNGSSWADAYTSVQPALNAATSGKQVWVASGRYVGKITLKLGVALYGGFARTEDPATFDLADRDLAANETILDGNRSGSVVTAPSGATATTRIDGFTITNGTGTVSGPSFYGGGLYLSNSSPTIANNSIAGNGARYGGGLYLSSSSPTITNNSIRGNTASTSGGGLYLYNSSPTIASNTITANRATGSSGRGGGLYLYNSSPTIANNTVTGNGAQDGGALYLYSSSSPTIANTIIAFNSSGVYRSGGTPTLRHNCVYGNTKYSYSGLTDPTGTNGNISADPRLADSAYGNAHLGPDSPCVDAGANADVLGDSDIDGQPRIHPEGGTVDIGADESDGTVWPPGPYGVVRVRPDGDDTHDGSSWGLAKRTVQAGIDAASALGGEVWVQGGTYAERLTLHPYAHVYGGFAGGETERDARDWRTNVTVLDGQQQGSVVTVLAGEHASTLDGFTITHGTGTSSGSDRYGGGLYLYSSSPTIANNTITGNTAPGSYYSSGGGLYLSYASPVIVSNTITDNTVTGSDGCGGGLYLSDSSPTIANNTITGNNLTGGESSGGGLYLSYSSPTIASNTIADNDAASGGGLALSYSSPTIANNSIRGNTALTSGGGLYLYNSSPTIANNTVTANRAFGSPGRGGGLYLYNSSPTIANNTVTGNGAQDGGALYLYSSSSPTIANTIIAFNSSGVYRSGGTPTLRHNCVYGNTKYSYSGLTDPTGTNGNISADPRLADSAYGNAHLGPDSPCVDAGANADVLGDSDIDGQPRIHPEGGTVDIGADESDGTVWPPGPYGVVRVRPDGDDTHDGSSWGLAKRTVQAGIDAASALGGEVWVQGGTYAERLTLHPYAHVYGGFAGGETERDARDWRTNVTVLDGQWQGSVVTVLAGEHASTLDGFTITHGAGTAGSDRYGGGLYLYSSSPTIANNIITGNTAPGIYGTSSSGGGLYLSYASPVIVNNTITDNSVTGSYGRGGGLYLSYSFPTMSNNTIVGNNSSYSGGGLYLADSSPRIANNTITGNGALYGGGLDLHNSAPTIVNNAIVGNSASISGGGLDLSDSSPTITNNTITDNTVTDDYASGGGLHLSYSSPAITNNTITGNTMTGSHACGGGLHLSCSSPTIANNAITDNRAWYGGGLCLSYSSPTIAVNTITGNGASNGGALYLYPSSSPTIANSLIAFNASGIYRYDTSSTPTLRHNCVHGNMAYNYSGIPDPTGTQGNISADPRFVQYPDNLHLLAGSPCIDAGSNALVPPDTFDLDGDGDTTEVLPYDLAGTPRFVDDPSTPDTGLGTPPIVDMGAYEYPPDCNTNGVIDTADIAAGTSLDCNLNARPDECDVIEAGDFDADGDVDLVDYRSFTDCLAGPAAAPAPPPPACVNACLAAFDADADGDVDLADFGVFQRQWAGPPGRALLVQAHPARDGALWRTAHNVIRLTFDRGLTAPALGQILIQALEEGGAFGPDLSAGFAFTLENDAHGRPRILRVSEEGSHLTHRTWIALRNLGAWSTAEYFAVPYVVMLGDVDHNGYVQNADAGAVYAHLSPLPVADDCPWDVDGDGYVKNLDAGALQPFISPVPPPPKPSGH